MKKSISFLLTIVTIIGCFSLNTFAAEDIEVYTTPEIVQLNSEEAVTSGETRASGLILSYSLSVSKNEKTLTITGLTNCSVDVVRCGFKDLQVERRRYTSGDWEVYHDYGDVYLDNIVYSLSTTLVVEYGYYYRVTCTHYAKKSWWSTQKVDNETNGIFV